MLFGIEDNTKLSQVHLKDKKYSFHKKPLLLNSPNARRLVVSSTKKGDIKAFALNIPSPARTPDNQDDHPKAFADYKFN